MTFRRNDSQTSLKALALKSAVSEQLFVNIHANRAADLIDKEQLDESKRINPVLVASFNGIVKKTKKKTSTNNPTWDQVLSFPLKSQDRGSVLSFYIWDKHRGYKNYLGELRLNLAEIFHEDSLFLPKTELKWYKLHSNSFHKSFITGSLLLSFELVMKKKRFLKKSQTIYSTIDDKPILKVEAPSRQPTKDDFYGDFQDMNIAEDVIAVPDSRKEGLFNEWKLKLIYTSDTLDVNEQGLYSGGDLTDVLMSDLDTESVRSRSSTESQPLDVLQKKLHSTYANSLSDYSIASQESSDIDDSDVSSIADVKGENTSKTSLALPERRKKRFSFKNKRDKWKSNFEVRNRKVDGVLFLEIVSCSDLPPVRHITGMGRFDMDPFVVVTFGKKTFRTSWKRHNLNPVFNERLAFEVLHHEKNFDINFLVLDKDRFSLHDDVASVSVPLKDLTKTATAIGKHMYLKPDIAQSGESLQEEFTDNELPANQNITLIQDSNLVETVEKKLIRKKVKMRYSDTSKFKTMDLALELANDKYKGTYSPRLKVRVRYETYDNLRKNFWRKLLEQYNPNSGEDKPYDYIELISLLDTLGCENSDDVVNEFFKKFGKLQWGGDTLTIDEICGCLEEHITANKGENKLFEIERCPNCLKTGLIKKNDLDIVTHFAICGSKDWSIVNKLLVSSYVTPQLASKRWFTKVLIKISYGKYQLGSNSANILVQDRTTGIILEEKMGIYVRLGIRLLYKGLDSAKKRRVRALMKKLSIKQGTKFDDPALRDDIPSFIRFHKLSLEECLESDPTKYETFNAFFYRKLKPGARVIEADHDDRIVVSPADCRCVAFDSVTESTEVWIKGRNFTIAKLFNGNFHNLEKTSLYKHDKCALGVFRLAPQDYHRFHAPVSGTIKEIKYIDGEYYTVNPMAIRSELDVFGENVRVLIAIETDHFGTVVMIPVGAMMVGSTILTKGVNERVKKGEEMGYFKFGGSTVILLFDQSKFKFDSDLTNNSRTSIETLIRVGQSVGHSPHVKQYERDHVDFSKLPEASKKKLIRVITGGDLADTKELKSWESTNIKLSDEDVESVVNNLKSDDEKEETDD